MTPRTAAGRALRDPDLLDGWWTLTVGLNPQRVTFEKFRQVSRSLGYEVAPIEAEAAQPLRDALRGLDRWATDFPEEGMVQVTAEGWDNFRVVLDAARRALDEAEG
jgi:hypothetical protein